MSLERLVVIVAAVAFSAMTVPAHAATIQIVIQNLVISPAEASAIHHESMTFLDPDRDNRPVAVDIAVRREGNAG